MLSNNLTIKSILEGYKKGDFSSIEVIDHYYERIKKYEDYEPKLNSLITRVDKDNIKISEKSIPVVHKDIYSTKGIKTTAASDILKGYIPPYNATSVDRLASNNFVCIGKANCDAFAHGTTGENSDFGVTRNPYTINYSPGGSSSGSAACVAAGFTPVATATDTGGSVRLPASFTNTVGIKPTYGRVSRYGIISMTSSTDSIGHITRTVWDSAYILNITSGFDEKDATSSKEKTADYLNGIERGIKNLVIGVPKEYTANLDTEIKSNFDNSLKVLEKLGAKLCEVTLPTTKYALYAYYIITPSEISSNLARFDGIRFGHERSKFGPEAKRRIIIGTYCLSSGYYDEYYLKAQKARTKIVQEFKDVLSKVDALVAPVSPILPPKLEYIQDDPLKAYMMDLLTVPVNIAGLPALATPSGFAGNLPIGIQFIGKHFDESLLYKIGYAFEQETKYFKKLPEFKVFP